MSEKNTENTENLQDTVNEKKELSSADKILQKIKEKQNKKNADDNLNKEVNSESEKKAAEPEKNENSEKNTENISETKEAVIQQEDTKEQDIPEEEVFDYSSKSKEEIIVVFKELLLNDDTTKYNKKAKSLRDNFYNLIKKEDQERKDKFIEDGGNADDYESVKDEKENEFKDLFQKFIDKQETWERKLNDEKKNNLELKYKVIKEIEELINKPETFNKTFNHFRELQKKWNAIGLVPKNDVKVLFDEYNKNVQKFYDYLEVNKELRELDFKKNFDAKIKLCEQAEELLLESNYSKAKKELQNLHKKWKETGSVSNENREDIWSRFQAATIKINEKFSEYIEEIKVQQEKNLESKQFLVSKADEYAIGEYTNHKEWKDASNQVVELQKLWKKIGYVPKEHNNEIYKQFKTACDKFFVRIREFYSESEKHKDDNYQKKLDLCVQAESLQDSNEWNNTSEIYKQIQNDWKTIGPVPKKYSDEIWTRFRKACNNFFDRKKEYFKSKKANEKENLFLKKEIIKEIEEFNFSDNQIEDLKSLKEFQNRFLEIGYVPFDSKDEIYKQYHNAIDTQLGKLNISKEKQRELKFNENLEIIKKSPGSDRLAYKEISRLQNQIDKLNDDIRIWENNIGFFSGSKESDSLIKNIHDKIETAKDKVSMMKKNIEELENISDE
ncbi:MAG: DUF349 domain-containing protein [Bacteroidales bacterium]|nr:DUF349 domain-containing protein [Bacteroidales bacterium]